MELIKFPFPCLFVFSDKERDEVTSVLIVYILNNQIRKSEFQSFTD